MRHGWDPHGFSVYPPIHQHTDCPEKLTRKYYYVLRVANDQLGEYILRTRTINKEKDCGPKATVLGWGNNYFPFSSSTE